MKAGPSAPFPGRAAKQRSIGVIRELFGFPYETNGFENSGLTLEFRFLVGIGRSGVMIGRLCLDMVS